MDLELKKVNFQQFLFTFFGANKLIILGILRDASEQDWDIKED